MRDILGLLDAIHIPICRPEYQPKGDTTHCNQFVSEVVSLYTGIHFEGMLANQIIDLLISSDAWLEVQMEQCQDMANRGTLIIAGFKNDPHGHVNVICPGKEKDSGRWGKVPSVANVGKDVFIGKGLSWAFSLKPRFWAWKSSIGMP